ncbi:hypothetical protein [Streptosporangium sp. NPDC002607]
MSTTILLGLGVGLLGALCPPTPGARTLAQVSAAARRAGWGRIAWLTILVASGTLCVLAYAIARGSGWAAMVGLTALTCYLATKLAMDGRALRVQRAAGGRA